MESILNNIYNYLIEIINGSVIYGPLFACLLIFLESILPILPLFVFITIIFITYGGTLGFLISYILTCLGCFFSFYLCRLLLKKFFKLKIRRNNNFDKLMQNIDKMPLSHLVILLAIPFTPAFVVNIASSLSEMNFKKFFAAILISKISLVFFWGFIGTSLIESLRNPKIIILILLMLLFAYLLSKFVTKKLNIK